MATMLPRTLLALCLLLSACKQEKTPQVIDEHAEKIKALQKEADAQFYNSTYPEALATYQKALALCDKVKDAQSWSEISKHIADLHNRVGKHDEAETLYREILAQNDEQLGKESLETADTLENLAFVVLFREDGAEIEILLRRAVAVRETILAKNTFEEGNWGRDSRMLSNCLSRLGALLENSKRFDEAEPLLRKALQVEVDCQTKTKTGNTSLHNLQDPYRSILVKMGDTEEQAQAKIDKMMEPLRKK